LGGFFIERREAFEKSYGDILVGRGGDELGVEVLRLGAVAEVEDADAVTGRDTGLARSAAGEEQGGGEE
jgi:hypothetical protein